MSKARTLANLISDNAELADGQISVAEVVGAAPTASPTFTGTVNADAITMSGFLTVNGGADFNTVLYPDGIAMADSRTISFGTSADFEVNGGSTFLDFNLKDNARHLRIKNGLVEHHRFSGDGSVIFNESGADANFRIESNNNANMLFVDAGRDQVAVGTSGNFTSKLTVVGNKTLSTGIPTNQLSVIDESSMAAGVGGAITLWGNYTTAGSDAEGASIEAIKDNATSGNYGFGMKLRTRTHGSTMDERLSLSNSSTVFNENGYDTDFRVESDSSEYMLYVDGGTNSVGIKTNATDAALNVNSQSNSIDGIRIVGSGGNNFITGYGNQGNLSFAIREGEADDAAELTLFRSGSAQHKLFADSGTSVVFNEQGDDIDFRVESDSNTNMLFVDGGEDIVSMGMPAGVPSWIGGNSVVVADNLYAFQGASYSNACFNLSVDNNFTYLLHNAYYGSGWKQRLTGYAPTMLQTGSAAYNFNYAADTGSDASISWISLMALNSSGAIFNEAGNAGQDFRVESNNNSNCFVIDANSDEIYLGKGSGAGASIGGIIHAKSNRFYQFLTETTTNAGDAIMYLNRQSSDGTAIYFRRANSNVGNISLTSSGTTYNTTSDRRLKDNIEPIADATDKLMSMKPVTHTWIANPEAPSVHGFIAQEMQEIVPEAVSGEDGGEEMMSMDYGRITPVLVAALQEATNEIKALKERVAELEAK